MVGRAERYMVARVIKRNSIDHVIFVFVYFAQKKHEEYVNDPGIFFSSVGLHRDLTGGVFQRQALLCFG